MAETLVPLGHEEPSAEATHLRHHFATPEQQMDASTLGMWTFLITEVLFFGGMFTSYAIYRGIYPGAFASTSRYMDVVLGGTNTAVLICSSLTMALAVRAAQLSNRKALIRFLILTMIFGTAFLVIKGVEYHSKWVEYLVPGFRFHYEPSLLCAARSDPLFSIFLHDRHARSSYGRGIGPVDAICWFNPRAAFLLLITLRLSK